MDEKCLMETLTVLVKNVSILKGHPEIKASLVLEYT